MNKISNSLPFLPAVVNDVINKKHSIPFWLNIISVSSDNYHIHKYVIHCIFDFTVYTTACGYRPVVTRVEETPTMVLSGVAYSS